MSTATLDVSIVLGMGLGANTACWSHDLVVWTLANDRVRSIQWGDATEGVKVLARRWAI